MNFRKSCKETPRSKKSGDPEIETVSRAGKQICGRDPNFAEFGIFPAIAKSAAQCYIHIIGAVPDHSRLDKSGRVFNVVDEGQICIEKGWSSIFMCALRYLEPMEWMSPAAIRS